MLAEDLDGFSVQAGPTTLLTGPITDSADLYGLIARLECFGLTLLSVQATTDRPPPRLWPTPTSPPPAGSMTMADTAPATTQRSPAPSTAGCSSRPTGDARRGRTPDRRRADASTIAGRATRSHSVEPSPGS